MPWRAGSHRSVRTARAADSGPGPGNAGRMPNPQLLHSFAKPYRHRCVLALTVGTLASTGANSARVPPCRRSW
jgi:hypothetical protein